jgi:hypothetical protein
MHLDVLVFGGTGIMGKEIILAQMDALFRRDRPETM